MFRWFNDPPEERACAARVMNFYSCICCSLPRKSVHPLRDPASVWPLPAAILCANPTKSGRLAGCPMETPAPAKTTSFPSRKAANRGSGKSMSAIFIGISGTRLETHGHSPAAIGFDGFQSSMSLGIVSDKNVQGEYPGLPDWASCSQ